MKQKANKYSSYFTPKIIIAIAIFLIIVNKPLFIQDEPIAMMDLLLFIPHLFTICLVTTFTEIVVTTGTIGSIIIISMGIIYSSFPIIDYKARHLKIPIDKCGISRARFGSKLIIISGFGLLIYFFIEFTRLYEFNLVIYLLEFEKLYFITLLFLCIIGTVLQKYDVSSYPMHMINNKNIEAKQHRMHARYVEDIKKIKNIKLSNNSIIDWGVSSGSVDSEDEFEWEFLHIRNDIESFIHVLFWVCILIGVLSMFLLDALDLTIILISFSGGFFLAIICPNAIDTKKIKFSRLITRLCGIGGILTFGIFSIAYIFADYLSLNIGVVIFIGIFTMVIGLPIGLISMIYLYIIYGRLDIKKYKFN